MTPASLAALVPSGLTRALLLGALPPGGRIVKTGTSTFLAQDLFAAGPDGRLYVVERKSNGAPGLPDLDAVIQIRSAD